MQQPRSALNVAVVMERVLRPNAWEAASHRIVDVLPDDGRIGSRVLRDDGRTARIAHGALAVQLYADEAEGYHLNLSSGAPVWFVMWRVADDDPARAWPEFVTLSYNEAGRLLDAQERVDNVPLQPEVRDWLQAFTDAHWRPEPKERRRPASFKPPPQR